jgi:hypothetical protein
VVGDGGGVEHIEHGLPCGVDADPVAEQVHGGTEPPRGDCGDRGVAGQRWEDLYHFGTRVRCRVGGYGRDLRIGEIAEAGQVWSRRGRHGYDQPPSL